MRERLGETLTRGESAPNHFLDGVAWGNKFFHRMITPRTSNCQRQCWSDLSADLMTRRTLKSQPLLNGHA